MNATFTKMLRTAGIALASSVVGFAVLNSMTARADVLSTIESQCATLGATEYQIAFVSSDYSTATSSNIQDYNNFVSTEAALGSSYLSDFVPAGTAWTAIASTLAVNATSNAPTYSGVPIFNTDGQLVLSDGSTLYDLNTLSNPIDDTQYGSSITSPVWTGSEQNGTGYYYLVMGSTSGFTFQGYSSNTADGRWLDNAASAQSFEGYPLYALSSPISAVPEPSTIALSSSALLGLGLAYLRRRSAKR